MPICSLFLRHGYATVFCFWALLSYLFEAETVEFQVADVDRKWFPYQLANDRAAFAVLALHSRKLWVGLGQSRFEIIKNVVGNSILWDSVNIKRLKIPIADRPSIGMAEANVMEVEMVDFQPGQPGDGRACLGYFCHKCSVEIDPKMPVREITPRSKSYSVEFRNRRTE